MSNWDPKETLDSIGLGRTQQKRSVRVADVIRNEISMLLVNKIRDPKVSDVSISNVDLSDDLKHAKVYFTLLYGDDKKQSAISGLLRAKGFIRSHLAKSLNLRYTPELRFIYDKTAEKVEEIERLFDEIAKEREENQEGMTKGDS